VIPDKDSDEGGAADIRRQRVRAAQSKLGSLLSDGISIEPDCLEAWFWCTLAAEQGDRVARRDVRRLERKLTADQPESGRQRVEHLHKTSRP